jgi:hypothetical protein
MKTKTHFALVDVWDDTGHSIVEHVAGVSLPGGSCKNQSFSGHFFEVVHLLSYSERLNHLNHFQIVQ